MVTMFNFCAEALIFRMCWLMLIRFTSPSSSKSQLSGAESVGRSSVVLRQIREFCKCNLGRQASLNEDQVGLKTCRYFQTTPNASHRQTQTFRASDHELLYRTSR